MSDDIKLAIYACTAVLAFLFAAAYYEPSAEDTARLMPPEQRPVLIYWQPKHPACQKGTTVERLGCAKLHGVSW